MSRHLYNQPNIEELISKTEDQNFEKKSARIQGKDLTAEFSAFANSSVEGGLVVLGIEKDTELVGINALGQDKINKLLGAQRDFCPEAKIQYKEINITNKEGRPDRLLLFFVEFSHDKVVKLNTGEAYERIADQTCKMKPEKIRQMEYDKREAVFEQELIPSLSIARLNQNLVKDFIDKWVERDGLANRPTVEDLIIMKGFGFKEGNKIKINNAGLLLFYDRLDEFIPGAKIRFLKYEGTKIETGPRSNIVKDKYFDGSITGQIDQLAEMIKTQIREFSFLGEDGKFKTVLEYPEFAWYEAVVNAVVHRAYSLKNACIFVRMFNDRVEVESPGNLPGIVTVENIYKENFPRNSILMQALLYLGYVKSASEGVDRIKEEMIGLGLPKPEFEDDRKAVQFKITLENDIEGRMVKSDLEDLAKLNQDILNGLNENEKKIIYYVLRNKEVQTSNLVEELQIPRPTVIKYMRELEEKEYIKRIGARRGPSVRYVINEVVFNKNHNKNRVDTKQDTPYKQGKLL